MKLAFFTIPVMDSRGATEELNQFLASHRVVTVDREFVANGSNSVWAVCVTVEEGGASASSKKGDRVDYRETLSEGDFRLFVKLRDLRKELSEKQGLPAYALFTNEQLAEMARQRVTTAARMASLSGVGDSRVEKYGAGFLEIIRKEPVTSSATAKSGPTDETKPSQT